MQHDSAGASGVSGSQIAIFENQADAVEAVRLGAIDAYASTALGNRMLADRVGSSVVGPRIKPESPDELLAFVSDMEAAKRIGRADEKEIARAACIVRATLV